MSVPAGFTGPLPTNPSVSQYIGRTIAATESLPPNLGGGAPAQQQVPIQPPVQPPPFVATATAGTPGTITPQAATAGQFDGGTVTADPLTPWNQGEYVETASGAGRYWDGTAWQTGQAP